MSQKSYLNNKATVYLIPTPIGNMEDITIRAINTLREVEVIFSEDTRVTRQLLNYLEINKKLISSHNYNEEKNEKILLDYLEKGYNVGVVTDRGTPVISDPGYEIVKIAIKNDYNVVSLPGPTALIPAITASGINPSPFTFYGFLNNKDSKRRKELEELKNLNTTIIFYEAPHRIVKTLEDIKNILGNRKICISREISKKFEEIYRGTVEEVLNELADEVKGEIVLIVDGNHEVKSFDNLSIIEHVNLYIKEGFDKKESIKKVAKERNINKNEVYNEYHKVEK